MLQKNISSHKLIPRLKMESIHREFVNWGKVFALISARTSQKINIWLILYNLFSIISYILIIHFRFQIKPPKKSESKEETVNNILLSLQISSYSICFFAHFIANWATCESFLRSLDMILSFDENLAKLGYHLNNKKVKKMFYYSLIISMGILFITLISNYVIEVVILETSFDFQWFSAYIPLALNYFSCYFIIVSLFLLYVRFSLLKDVLNTIFKLNDSITVIKAVSCLFMKLVDITNNTLPQFSLRICTILLLSTLTITNNTFLMVKGAFTFWYYFSLASILCLHVTKLFALTIMHYQLRSKIGEINSDASRLIVLKPGSQNQNNDVLDCFLLLDNNRIDVQVFGMFAVTPATLLSILTWVLSYLIIMLQFLPEGQIKQNGWIGHSPPF